MTSKQFGSILKMEEIVVYQALKKIQNICENIEDDQLDWDFTISMVPIKEAVFCVMEDLKMIIGDNQIEKWEYLAENQRVVNE